MSTQARYVYSKYYPKSLNFLYPLIGFDKEDTFQPSNTYLWWKGTESIETLDLLVYYEQKESKMSSLFEKKALMKNDLLESCYDVEGGKMYIFNMAPFADTVAKFMEGKYSQFEEKVKKRILSYHNASLDKIARPGRPFHTALYPELYYEHVAREIKVPVDELREIGELCNIFNKEKETLKGEIVQNCGNIETKGISLDTK